MAVPLFGIEELGVGSYLKSYAKPTFIMLPFNHHQRSVAHAGPSHPPVR